MPITLLDGDIILTPYDIAEELARKYTDPVRIQPIIGTQSGYILHKNNVIMPRFSGVGIYSIHRDGDCMYVGASKNVSGRLGRFVKAVRGTLRPDENHHFGTWYRDTFGEQFDVLEINVYPYEKDMKEVLPVEKAMMSILSSVANKRRN